MVAAVDVKAVDTVLMGALVQAWSAKVVAEGRLSSREGVPVLCRSNSTSISRLHLTAHTSMPLGGGDQFDDILLRKLDSYQPRDLSRPSPAPRASESFEGLLLSLSTTDKGRPEGIQRTNSSSLQIVF